MGVSRFADDKEMNEELKERGRWNDPMAALVGGGKSGKGKGKSKGGGKMVPGG